MSCLDYRNMHFRQIFKNQEHPRKANHKGKFKGKGNINYNVLSTWLWFLFSHPIIKLF